MLLDRAIPFRDPLAAGPNDRQRDTQRLVRLVIRTVVISQQQLCAAPQATGRGSVVTEQSRKPPSESTQTQYALDPVTVLRTHPTSSA